MATNFSCKDCPNRTFDCHVKCKSYNDTKEEIAKMKHDIRVGQELDQYIIETKKKKQSRQLRKYGRSLIKTKN